MCMRWTRTATAFLSAVATIGLAAAVARGGEGGLGARLRADFERLHTLRQSRRAELFAVPGVVGVGTEVRERPRRVVITIYVTENTPAVRAAVSAMLPGEPVEIVETPGGFRAY